MQLKNRLVMSAIGSAPCGVWGEVTDNTIEWYARRARGGVGLVIVQPCHVAIALAPDRMTARMLRADDRVYEAGLYDLAEAVHDAGSKICVQLSIGGGDPVIGTFMPGERHVGAVVSPSSKRPLGSKQERRELTVDEIKQMVEAFGVAAARVKTVGFDAIEIHAHILTLLANFMSPYLNERTDQYGGSLEKRVRFPVEIINAIRQKVGPDFPITFRYSVSEYAEGERDLNEGIAIARLLEKAGVDAINVSQSTYSSLFPPICSMYYPEAYMLPLAEALKKAIRIPVILAGRLGNPVLADKVLAEGKADFIGMARPLIADPDLPRKVKEGRVDEIRRCISCNECRESARVRSLRCTMNAAAGRERRYDTLKPTERVKKVVVVGAGPGGMEAARVAALRGHQVKVLEQSSYLGGEHLKLASVPPHKEVLKNIVDYYSVALKALDNVDIEFGKTATADSVLREKPDAVIIATGGSPLIPNVPGIERKNVVTALDVLAGANVGKTVVVVGGGLVGLETAHFLGRQNKKVTVAEMLDAIGADVEDTTLIALKQELPQAGVTILTGTRLDAVTDQGVVTVDKHGKKATLPAETVVLAVGMKPENSLATELAGKVTELYTIGDAKRCGKIINAVADGFAVAFNI
jgi:2,4-dienoyl-CoA reductase-like NADH-dependent reductase (Old Yellow Enzyme family)/thioredoxin reductase